MFGKVPVPAAARDAGSRMSDCAVNLLSVFVLRGTRFVFLGASVAAVFMKKVQALCGLGLDSRQMCWGRM